MLELVLTLIATYNSMGDSTIVPDGNFAALAKTSLITYIVIAVLIYIFKSIAIYSMCKRNKIENSWLAFVPFVNFYLIGKLVGTIRVFSWKIKNSGWILSVLFFLTFCNTMYLDITACYDEFQLLITQNIVPTVINVDRTILYSVLSVSNYILALITIVFVVDVMLAFTAKFNRRHMLLYGIAVSVCLLLEPFYIIFNFALACLIMVSKKNEPFDVVAYINQQEAYRKMMQEQYNRANNNEPFSYGQTPMNRPTQHGEDPFAEFSDNKESNLKQDVFSDFKPSSSMNGEQNQNANGSDNNQSNVEKNNDNNLNNTNNADNSSDKDDDLFN